MTERLTLQIYTDNQWHDAAELIITEPQLGRASASELNYHLDYLSHFDERAETAVSFCYRVETLGYHKNNWLRFIDDIMPAGSSREYWVKKLGISDISPASQDFILLQQGTIAPIGNLRIKEAVPVKVIHDIAIDFTIGHVVERDIDFIEYAQENGAAAGGATGAGGAAPKMLLRCSPQDNVWIDTFQDDPANLDTHYLVKFPRGKSPIDKDILRAEFHFYHELKAMGFDTIPTDNMRLLEGTRVPSLWLPRFDTYIYKNKMQHCGLESVYSILDEQAARPLLHGDVLARLIQKMTKDEYFGNTKTMLDEPNGITNFVIEWVRRDLLNIAFGNSDNHGRNTSFIKSNNTVTLAPIYDFAPMKADPEVISRTFTWGHNMERGGNYNFPLIAEHLSKWVEPDVLLNALQVTAKQLINLKTRLEQRGVPESIINYSSIGFANLEIKLKKWGLLA
jgi:serine/threonine-protein kinase HipA